VPEVPSFIAIIDEDASMCQALRRMLRLAGYDVRIAIDSVAMFWVIPRIAAL
jgi:DNA-binding NtrC family response regulator